MSQSEARNSPQPKSYELVLELNPESETFQGKVEISLQGLEKTSQDIELNARQIEVTTAKFRSEKQPERALNAVRKSEEEIRLPFPEPPIDDHGVLTLEFRGTLPALENAGLFRRKSGQSWGIYSQFEPLSARKAFPCFDSPEYKTTFELSIISPQGYQVVSNMPSDSSQLLDDGRMRTHFPKSPPLPTYLLALSVARLDFIPLGQTQSGAEMRLLIPPGQREKANFTVEFAPKSLVYLEDYFGIYYPFAKLDLLSIPSFPGAMENPGLITFNERLLLRDPFSISQDEKELSAEVIAHEMAHQWFGDLVTMGSWQDLWLNEGFASWLGPKAVRTLFPEWEGELSRFDQASEAMSMDRLNEARRIREKAETRSDVASAFDGITYEKTASILSMFENYLTEEKFREAIQQYVRSHPFGILSGEDFLNQLSRSFGPRVAQSFSSFLDQKGVPLLTFSKQCRADGYSLLLQQERYRPLGGKAIGSPLWGVPYCLLLGVPGQSHPEKICGILDRSEEKLDFPKLPCPQWLLGNAGASGYYYSNLDLKGLDELLASAWATLSRVERRGILRDLRASIDAGKISWAETLERLPKIIEIADDDIIYSSVELLNIRSEKLSDTQKKNFRTFLDFLYRPTLERLGMTPRTGESHAAELLRTRMIQVFVYAVKDEKIQKQLSEMAEKWLKNPRSISNAMKSIVLSTGLSKHDPRLWRVARDKLSKAKSESERSDLFGILRSVTTKDLLEKNYQITLDDQYRLSESFGLIEAAMNNAERQREAWGYLKGHLANYLPRLPEDQRDRTISIVGTLCDENDVKELQSTFASLISSIEGGERTYNQTQERIELCLARRAKQDAGLSEFFSRPHR